MKIILFYPLYIYVATCRCWFCYTEQINNFFAIKVRHDTCQWKTTCYTEKSARWVQMQSVDIWIPLTCHCQWLKLRNNHQYLNNFDILLRALLFSSYPNVSRTLLNMYMYELQYKSNIMEKIQDFFTDMSILFTIGNYQTWKQIFKFTKLKDLFSSLINYLDQNPSHIFSMYLLSTSRQYSLHCKIPVDFFILIIVAFFNLARQRGGGKK